mmetsp:Transcript_69571/g.175318  ORF Transcript_69571/g.175318 Transcript_69571/m.175318 type:complete len:90 (-) Transcript_69571:20-289(-)
MMKAFVGVLLLASAVVNGFVAPSVSRNVERVPTHTELPMKVVSSIGALKRRSKDCQVVRRRGRLYVISKNGRFKVRQGGAKMKKRRKQK